MLVKSESPGDFVGDVEFAPLDIRPPISTRTTWLRWFFVFTTRTMDPSGRVGCAAVSPYIS